MRISLDALLVLDSIARNGSFAAAGEELHRVPSAITYTIQKLEQDLEVKLFDRSGHRARLTEAGEALLREGRVAEPRHLRPMGLPHRILFALSPWPASPTP